ncbi:divergent PAP2 family protein [Oscillospiraceae bacterium OttesenSCG-928-G22]|nr:divergent PAP2 family protein [Oscillospiraceae bacterium OttesenSCG-928-G22]
MNYVRFLTGNKVLNTAIVCWFAAQILKFIIVLITERRVDVKRMLGSGGMPSSHSSCTVGMATMVARVCGFYAPEFAISAVLAFIVMYDASNVRHAAGEQAKVLNYMIRHWRETTPEIFGRELKELLGHTPLQVVVGALLGLGIGLIM